MPRALTVRPLPTRPVLLMRHAAAFVRAINLFIGSAAHRLVARFIDNSVFSRVDLRSFGQVFIVFNWLSELVPAANDYRA